MKSILIFLVLFTTTLFSAGIKLGENYVKSDSAKVLLSASDKGKETGKVRKYETVTVLEIKNNYARVSKYYDGWSEGVDGTVARWVSVNALSAEKPVKKIIESNSPVKKYIENSDDFEKYYDVMIKASEELIKQGKCTLKDFEKFGPWGQSTIKTRGENYYFIYCGAMRSSNKIYLNVLNGKIEKD